MKMLQKTWERRRERGLLDDVPRCSRCDNPNDRLPQRYCSGCHAKYQQKWRASHPHVSREVLSFTRGGSA